MTTFAFKYLFEIVIGIPMQILIFFLASESGLPVLKREQIFFKNVFIKTTELSV